MGLLTLKSATLHIPCCNHRFTIFLRYCVVYHAFLLPVGCVFVLLSHFVAYRSYLQSRFCSPPTSFLFSSSGFSPSTFHLICKAAEFLSCCQRVPSWVLFRRWYVAVCCSAAPLSTSVFLGISNIDGIRPPSPIGRICPSPYRPPPLQFPNSQPEPCYAAVLMHSSYCRMCAALFLRSVSIFRTLKRISSPSIGLAASVNRCQRIWVW